MSQAGLWFQNKSVLVTGGAAGMGRAAARRFAEEGAKVCIADLDLAGAGKVAEAITAKGGQAFALKVDITKPEENDRMMDEAARRHGALDVAFLNAGIYKVVDDLLTGDLADFDSMIAVNLRGAFLGMRSAAKHLKRGGAAVVTASIGGLQGVAFNPAYSAAKHGVVGLVRSLAGGFAERGLRINAVCPGSVHTQMTRSTEPDIEVAPDALPLQPFQTRIYPAHIAEAVLFLASNRSAGMNGTCMVVDNGQSSGTTRSRDQTPP
jgi:NAD(P)-dependent dehydrogenase (short-subunit alcohol dehydrogenase family)